MKLHEIYSEVIDKLTSTAPQIGSTFPHVVKDGKWYEESDICWWTNGYWPGMLWQAYDITGNDMFSKLAEECEDKLDKAFDIFVGLAHDVGFMWGDSSVANYKITGNKRSRDRALHAATILAGRFDVKWGMIRSWNEGWENARIGKSIVDGLMNLRLLFWASETTGNMSFRNIAIAHANGFIEKIVREDGTFPHITQFDSKTGDLVNFLGGQGYSPDSQWSRGQAWAIYGFTRIYEYTGDRRYLDVAVKCADNFINKCGAKTPNWDFCAPAEDGFIPDTSAGACAASGMITMSQYVENSKYYIDSAKSIITDMYERYKTDGPMLISGGSHDVPRGHNIDTGVIFGDFYFLEALRKLCDKNYRNIYA